MKWMKLGVQRAVLAIAMVVGFGSSVFAAAGDPPASCTALGTTSTATIQSAISCVADSINVGGFIGAVLIAILPLVAIVWGLKGGFGIVKRVVGALFSSIRRAA